MQRNNTPRLLEEELLSPQPTNVKYATSHEREITNLEIVEIEDLI
jgi:hypothetical protein